MLAGFGYLLGSLVSALLLYLTGAVGLRLGVAPALTVFGVLFIGGLWLSRHLRLGLIAKRDANLHDARDEKLSGSMPVWQALLFWALLLWLLVRLLGLALEVWWQPLVPWDAWTTWAVRARVWTELQSLVPFIAPSAWLADPTAASYTIDASSYPLTVSLIAAWPALAYGAWNEAVANLPWFGCALALALGFYGQSRLWGASPLLALLFVWLLFSLPLLNTHIALAGYADLWLATTLGFALMAFLHWARDRERRQGAIAIILILALPAIKQEGAVWAVMFLPAFLAIWLPLRAWLMTGLAVIMLGFAIWNAGGIEIMMPGLGELSLGPDAIVLPALGKFQLSYQGDWSAISGHLFERSSWHLLYYALILAVINAFVQSLRTDRNEPWSRAGLAWVVAVLLGLYLLFFWTDAAQWAIKGTSINRVLLQFVPALLFWMQTSLNVFETGGLAFRNKDQAERSAP
jgi:hypothetical protein